MIYFTSNKRAFGSSIEGYIATIDDEIWRHYADEIAGTDWDIVDGQFVQITSVDDMIYRASSIERDGIRYGVAYDPVDSDRTYTETEEKIPEYDL